MRILYDYQIFSAQRFGGISRYFVELMRGIEARNEVSYSLDVFGNVNHYLAKGNARDFGFVEKLRKHHRKSHRILDKNRNKVIEQLNNKEVDVFHPTYFDPYFVGHLSKPLVITVHDMTYENFPEFFWSGDPTAYQKRILIARADKIIAISDQTKNDILKHYDVDESRIEVIYHGIDAVTPIHFEEVRDIPAEYILYVGSRNGYKNFSLLVQAFGVLSKRYSNIKLVLAGGPLEIAEKEHLYRNRILDKTIQIAATDEQLNTLYRNALFFVYPSIYEGFGLPILEAFKNRCPILLSNASCFPEIAGEAAAYFEALALDSLIEQMECLLTDTEYRAKLVEKGDEQLKHYKIDSCVEKTIGLYQKLM
ncbi:glycosyltransferase family 4 protein [Sphingobacterium pedocola]|uniref:Glycosyltransferase family 1 protein n=1 Tax=Sphingobacterium pedocola TaxID=2082722 RepID=A0ABR9TAE9_9SPHI|nr:glycosyltransferase family 1 protein [Sphingobacterium pedocola]MBE8722311.1 glycosyltransferase family 1 protein [Sphingobacterium pedocola]